MYELTAGIHPGIGHRIDDFLELERYDAAVREASVILEDALGALVTTPKPMHGNNWSTQRSTRLSDD